MKDQAKTKEFEEKLKESEDLYQAVIDSIDTVLHVVDSDLRLIIINNAFVLWCEDLGIDTDVIGKTIFEVFAFLPERVRDEYRQVFETGKTVITIESNVVGDSEIITETRKSPIIRDNKVEQVSTVVQDITERTRAEEALSESEKKYRTLVEQSLQGIMIAQGPSPRIVFTNPAMSKISGYTIKEFRALTPKEIGELIHPEDQEKVLKRFKDRLEGKKVVPHYEFRMIRKNGEEVWVDMSSTQIIYEGQPAIQATLTDITDHKKAEAALRESVKKYRDLVEKINDVVYSTDKEGVITYISPVVQALTGYGPSEIVGKNLSHFLHKEDLPRIQNMFKQVLKGHLQPSEYRITTKNRGVRWVRTSSRPIMGNDGPVGLQGIMTDITEHKEAEAKNSFLAQAVESSPLSIIAVDKEGKISYLNPATEQLFGYKKDELLGKNPGIVNSEADAEKIQKDIFKTIATGKEWHGEILNRKKDGHLFQLEARVYRLFDENGDFIADLGYQQDISERKKTEEALRASEAKYKNLVENSQDSIIITDLKGNVQFANKATEKLTGYKIEEGIGMNIREVTLPKYWPKSLAALIKAKSGKQVPCFESMIKRKDCRLIPVESWGQAIVKDEKPVSIQLITRDISERKRTEEELKFERFILEEFFENLPLLAYIIGADGKIKNCNKQALKTLGYEDKKELVGKPFLTTIYAPSSQKKAKDLLIEWNEKGKLKNEELQIITMQGKILNVLLNVDTIYAKNGTPLHSISTQIDITERKRSEEELKKSREELKDLAAHLQSGREEERTSIAREIHDELGQALTALKMDLFWLKKRLPEDQRPYLEKIQSMVDLTDRTIGTMKRISTDLRPSMLDDLGLVAAIEWQTEEFQKRTGIKCTVAIDFEEIELDEEKRTAIFRIFQETLTNIARHADATRVRISLRKRAKSLELEVRDNGEGITEENISDTKAFGLMGIRERVQFIDGELKISGAPNKGTKVLVKIPLPDKGAVG